jgi:hypothetical protein
VQKAPVLRRGDVRYGFEATVEENSGRANHVFTKSQIQRGAIAGGGEHRERAEIMIASSSFFDRLSSALSAKLSLLDRRTRSRGICSEVSILFQIAVAGSINR